MFFWYFSLWLTNHMRGRDQSSDVHSPGSPSNKVAVHSGGVSSSVNDIGGLGWGGAWELYQEVHNPASYPVCWHHQLSNHLLLFARGAPLEVPNNFCLYCSTSWLKRISVLFPLAFFLGTYKRKVKRHQTVNFKH